MHLREAAKITGLGYYALYGACQRGQLAYEVVDGAWCVSLEDAEAYLASLPKQQVEEPRIHYRTECKSGCCNLKFTKRDGCRCGIYADPMKDARLDRSGDCQFWERTREQGPRR